MTDHLPIHTGEHLCANSFRALIATWLNVFRRSLGVDRLNRSAPARKVKRFEQSQKLNALFVSRFDSCVDV